MNKIFDQANWITLGRSPEEYRTKVNPWEFRITEEVRNEPMPKGCGIGTFYKKFRVEKPLKAATIHITSLGCFNLYVNGEKISTDELAPGWTKATLHLPIGAEETTYVVDGTTCAADGCRKDGCLVLDVAPGEHRFESRV